MSANVKNLVPYYGGASSMVEVMRYLMESAYQLGCTKLVETMSGSGVISINRDTRFFPEATLIEKDIGMATLLKVMADPELSVQFMRRVRVMSPSILDFIICLRAKEDNFKDLDGRELSIIQIAEVQYYLLVLSRNAACKVYSDRKINFENKVKNLWEVMMLMKGCTVYNDDFFVRILDYIHDEHSLIIMDPPFLESLRSSVGQYEYEFSDLHHDILLFVLTKRTYKKFLTEDEVSDDDILANKKPKLEDDVPKAKVILFGFESEKYTRALTKTDVQWYQFIMERPLLSSNKTVNGKKEMQRKAFWINFLPSEYAKSHVLELNHLKPLTEENLEEFLERDREFEAKVLEKQNVKKGKAKKQESSMQ